MKQLLRILSILATLAALAIAVPAFAVETDSIELQQGQGTTDQQTTGDQVSAKVVTPKPPLPSREIHLLQNKSFSTTSASTTLKRPLSTQVNILLERGKQVEAHLKEVKKELVSPAIRLGTTTASSSDQNRKNLEAERTALQKKVEAKKASLEQQLQMRIRLEISKIVANLARSLEEQKKLSARVHERIVAIEPEVIQKGGDITIAQKSLDLADANITVAETNLNQIRTSSQRIGTIASSTNTKSATTTSAFKFAVQTTATALADAHKALTEAVRALGKALSGENTATTPIHHIEEHSASSTK